MKKQVSIGFNKSKATIDIGQFTENWWNSILICCPSGAESSHLQSVSVPVPSRMPVGPVTSYPPHVGALFTDREQPYAVSNYKMKTAKLKCHT